MSEEEKKELALRVIKWLYNAGVIHIASLDQYTLANEFVKHDKENTHELAT